MSLFRRGRNRRSDAGKPESSADADLVWNRAALERGGSNPRPGDDALAALLRVHNIAMNGGLLHSVEHHAEADIEQALYGYRYFGLSEAADVIQWVVDQSRSLDPANPDAAEDLELDADAKYAAVVPDDSALVDRFQTVFRNDPQAFAPRK